MVSRLKNPSVRTHPSSALTENTAQRKTNVNKVWPTGRAGDRPGLPGSARPARGRRRGVLGGRAGAGVLFPVCQPPGGASRGGGAQWGGADPSAGEETSHRGASQLPLGDWHRPLRRKSLPGWTAAPVHVNEVPVQFGKLAPAHSCLLAGRLCDPPCTSHAPRPRLCGCPRLPELRGWRLTRSQSGPGVWALDAAPPLRLQGLEALPPFALEHASLPGGPP